MALNEKLAQKRGFSLMELLIVIGIIAVIAVIAVPITIGILNKTEEKNDEVLASTYTEYVQKFANEQAGSAQFYPTLSVGENSEYSWLSANSGNGKLPGLSAISAAVNQSGKPQEDVWHKVRKEVCIVIKAYGDEDSVYIKDGNYFVKKPTNDKLAFVYYYLTGEIKLKPVAEMNNNKLNEEELKAGNINTDDYWVYLDREGGSGKVTQPEDGYNFYIQILEDNDDIIDRPLSGANVTIAPVGNGIAQNVETSSNGLICFSDVYTVFNITVTHPAALDFPNAEIYDQDGYFDCASAVDGYGLSPANPYKVYMKVGTRGDVQFYETQTHYSYKGQASPLPSAIQTKINWVKNDFLINFDSKVSDIRDSVYNHSVNTNGDALKLWGIDSNNNFRFLTYGPYKMTVTDVTEGKKQEDVFDNYIKDITSEANGIYEGSTAPSSKKPYTYDVILKRKCTVVKGYIIAENKGQPLIFTDKAVLASSTSSSPNVTGTSSLSDTAQVVLKNGSDVKTANLIKVGTHNECDVYTFEIYVNKNDGTEYELYLDSLYGTNSKMEIKAWPEKIKADGSTHILNSAKDWEECVKGNYAGASDDAAIPQVSLENDVDNGNLSITLKTEDTNDSEIAINLINFNLTLSRNEYGVNYPSVQEYESNNGKVETTLKQGFYTATISLTNPEMDTHFGHYFKDGANPKKFTIFIDDTTNIVIVLSFTGEYTIKAIPYTSGVGDIPYEELKIDNVLQNVGAKFDVLVLGDKKVTNITSSTLTRIMDDNTMLEINGIKDISFTADEHYLFIKIETTAPLTHIRVQQTSDCFNDSDFSKERTNGYNSSVSIPYGSNSFEGEFRVHRTENNTKESYDNWHATTYYTVGIDTENDKHYFECPYCQYRFTEDHFSDMFERENTHVYYFTQLENGNDNKTQASHVKHCNVCKMYDLLEDCETTDVGHTSVYNLYSSDVQHTSHGGTLLNSAWYTLKDTATTSLLHNSSSHYQYCKLCHSRATVDKHTWDKVKPETGHDNCLGNKECKDIGEQHRKLCSVCNWGSTPEDHQTKATAGIKETKFFDASNKEVTKEADAAKKVTYYYCEPCGHYIGKDEETVQEVCDHYWHGTCGYTHTANTSVNLVHSTCSVRTNKSHCWSCNTTEFTYGSDETCTGCINGHSRAKFSCITCTHCGISQYAYQGTHKGTMWCAFHCQYIGAGSITAVNKNQNVTSGQKESVHWCEKWNNITNSHVTYYVKKDALGTYWGP